jgi:hypothetical protein
MWDILHTTIIYSHDHVCHNSMYISTSGMVSGSQVYIKVEGTLESESGG